MQDLERLRRAVAEALAYLREQPDVEEAEVFASSNGQLLTRLHYTSHIPCNGVEEPKSTESYGIGVTAVFRGEGGPRVGFGSEAGDLTLEGVKSALAKARAGAVHDPEFESLPRPTGEQRTLYDYHDPALMEVADADLTAAGWTTVNGALRTFLRSEALAIAAGGQERLPGMGLIVGGDVTILQERVAIASSAMPEVQTDETTAIMGFVTAMVEEADAKGSGWASSTRLAGFDDEAGREAAAGALAAMGGVRVPSGEYRVVLGRQAVTDLMNNIVLPSLNLGTFYAAGSAFQGKLGQQVAADLVTIYDDGARPGYVGSKGITDEGLPTGRTRLIERGRLVGLLANWYESRRILKDPQARAKLGADPREWAGAFVPRSGFRFARSGGRHFDAQPGIAATNVFIEGPDPKSREELLHLVGNGLYIGRIWYTYPVNGLRTGDFSCTVVGDSFVIRDGRLAEPIKPNTLRISDSIHRVLHGCLGIGREAKPTMVWAADEITYAPELAVSALRVQEIAGFLEGG